MFFFLACVNLGTALTYALTNNPLCATCHFIGFLGLVAMASQDTEDDDEDLDELE